METSIKKVFPSIFRTRTRCTSKQHFISLAPEFGIHDLQLDRTYHYTSHQLCLQSAAQELGHKFTIVAPTTCSIESETILPLLSSSESANQPSEISGLINKVFLEDTNERIVILLYEGSLDLANEFLILARQFPSVFFVINLFLSEPHYNLDSAFTGYLGTDTKGAPDETNSPIPAFNLDGGKLTQTANLEVFCETETKSFAARLLGISAIKQWRNFSAIFDVRCASREQNDSNGRQRVLLPLSSWQLGEKLVDDMLSVKRETDKLMDQKVRIDFHLAGYHLHDQAQHLLTRLGEAGFKVTSESRLTQDYAELISSHDVVWLPNRYYILQSSGKALDALVQGTPIIAPVGTYGWREQNRWVAGAPGYSSTKEARDLFLNLRFILPAVASELKRQNEKIRNFYSPCKTIQELVSATEDSGS